MISVSAEFGWQSDWMEAKCDPDMRKWQMFWSNGTLPRMVLSSKIVGNTVEMAFTHAVEPHTEMTPAEICKCGFWNLNDLRSAGLVMHDEIGDGVMILTESRGKIVLHNNGFRSQYCKPVAVVYPFTYRMQTKWYKVEDVYRISELVNGADGLYVREKVWVSKIRSNKLYGHTYAHESIMAARSLCIPVLPPSEVTNMLRNNRMENNL